VLFKFDPQCHSGTKTARAAASESSPMQWLPSPSLPVYTIPVEEHCVPEAGMQWHFYYNDYVEAGEGVGGR